MTVTVQAFSTRRKKTSPPVVLAAPFTSTACTLTVLVSPARTFIVPAPDTRLSAALVAVTGRNLAVDLEIESFLSNNYLLIFASD